MLRTLINVVDKEQLFTYLFSSYLSHCPFLSPQGVFPLPLFVPVPGTSDSVCINTGHVNHFQSLSLSVYSQFSCDHTFVCLAKGALYRDMEQTHFIRKATPLLKSLHSLPWP